MDTVLITPDARPAAPKFPGFVLGWAITDLVMCLMRLMIVFFWTFGMIMAFNQNMMIFSMFMVFLSEIVSGSIMVLCGIPAGICLICRKRFGVKLAYAAIIFTIINILIDSGLWGSTAWVKSGGEMLAITAFMLISLAGRVTLLVFYWKAVKRASKYFAARDAAATPVVQEATPETAPIPVATTSEAGM